MQSKDQPEPISTPQHTLARAVSRRAAVRRGVRATLVLHPAAANSGVRIRRRGVAAGNAEIRAHWESVVGTDPTLVLANTEGVALRGVTPLLAALRAVGVDNVLVEVNGGELPDAVSDFYAYLEAIVDGGIQAQDAPREALRVDEVVEVRDGAGFAVLVPAQDFTVGLGVATSDHGVGGVLASGVLSSDLVEPAQGRLPWESAKDSQCVATRDGPAPLWDPRALPPLLRAHMINTIGHLALAGAALIGHMRGYRSSAALHHALLRALMSRRAASLVTVDEHRKSVPGKINGAAADSDFGDEEPRGYYH